ncbi:MAG: hypothetical protein Q9220_005307 [cf. Caloplaca sp. 1 TL-2023]
MPSQILSFRRSNSHQRRDQKSQPSHVEDLTDINTGVQRRHTTAMDLLHLGSKEKRKSSSGHSSPKNKGSPKISPAKPAKFEVHMESPPCVFYGGAQSTGALLSGQLTLIVTDIEARLTSIRMDLKAYAFQKKPVSKDCRDCINQITTLKTWNFLTEPVTYDHGIHRLPFSYLLPGHLPATIHSHLATIDYALDVQALTAFADTITHQHPIPVYRALPPTEDKDSFRVFPPINISINVIHPQIIHPIGSFLVQLRMNAVVVKTNNVTLRWRIRRIDWRIEEHTRNVSPACSKHAHKVGGEGKGQQYDHERLIGSDSLKSGWKTDFDMVGGGQIEIEFPASIRPGSHPVCDVESPTGLVTTHFLSIETIIAEEHVRVNLAKNAIPTGAARVLKTSFRTVVTERGGLGISWDNEQPPMYEDVPPESPPTYITDYVGPPLPVPPEELLEQMEDRA